MTRPLLFALAAGLACAEPLADVLARMDASAGGTISFAANLRWDDYTKAIKDHDEKTGTMRMKRAKGRLSMRMDIEKPAAQVYYFSGDQFGHYMPKANAVEVWQVSKLMKSADQYSSLAFGLMGVTGKELQKTYTVTAGEEETISGVRTTRLELVPKDKKVRDEFPRVELWVAAGQTYAMQQKVWTSSGNYKLYTYSELKLNPALPDSAFEFAAPAGTVTRKMN